MIADRWGNVFAFDERDCTVQRNNQKLLEVTPSPWRGMTPNCAQSSKTMPAGSCWLWVSLGCHRGVPRDRSGRTLHDRGEHASAGRARHYRKPLRRRLGRRNDRYRLQEHPALYRGKYAGLLPCPSGPRESGGSSGRLHPNSGLITRYVSPGGPGVRLDSNLSAGYEFPSTTIPPARSSSPMPVTGKRRLGSWTERCRNT